MVNPDVERLMEVWETENKIELSSKKKICFDIIDQIASLFSVGPFYYYIFNFENLRMEYISDGTREVLGIEPNEYSLQKGFEIIHPEDLARLSEQEAVAVDFMLNKKGLRKLQSRENLVSIKSILYWWAFLP